MKLSGFLLVFCLINFVAISQQNGSIVTGRVVDSIAKRGLAYTTVSIVKQKDSTLVSFARADSAGSFKLNALPKGDYLLSFSYVGYLPLWKPISLNGIDKVNLGILQLTDLLHAGEVVVTARRPPIVINNDTVEFNTENFKTQPNAVVEDLLKKLPGVTVDRDGTVSVNGQKVNRFLVNGKEFFTGDPKLATKNLDADAVDKVQVFDKKSDRSEFTGIEDGQTSKTINLKLKKDRDNSVFGRVTAGAGNKNRFEGQTNINRFKGDKQISLLGMANNTNKQGFSISDIMNFTGDLARGMRNGGGINITVGENGDNGGLPISGMGQNQQGIARTIAGGLNYNNNWKKKTDLNLSGIATDVNLQTDRIVNRANLLPGNNFNYTANSTDIRQSQQQRMSAALDHKIDSFTSLKFTPQITTQKNLANTNANYISTDARQNIINEGNTRSNSISDALNFNSNLLVRRRFRKKGRTLSSTTSVAYNNSKQNGSLNTTNRFYNAGLPLPDSVVSQINQRDATTRSIGTNFAYTEGIGKTSLLELSGFYNINIGESKREVLDYNRLNGKFDNRNNTLSNDFRSVYTYSGGGFSFRSNFKKMNITTGANLQVATLESINKSNATTIQQSFTDILPMMAIQFKLQKSVSIGLNYNTSTTQPSTQLLQPVADITDPLNTYTGNPNLKRSYTQTISMNLFSINMFTQRNLFSYFSYSRVNNAFANADRVLPNGSRITMPVNANGNYFMVGNINVGFPIKRLKSRIDMGITANSSRNISFINDAKNTIDNYSITPNLGYQFTVDSIMDIHLTVKMNFNKAQYSLQPKLNNNFLQTVYGIDITNYLPGGLIMNNLFDYTINSGRSDGFNIRIPFWNISLAKSFLKYKKGELKFSVMDLLNKNQGVNRTANQNFIQDTRYNVLQRYFMLSFSYRLNKSGNAKNGAGIMIKTF